MKLLKTDLVSLKTHAHKIEGVWNCKKTGAPIIFSPQSSFFEPKSGEMYGKVIVITFVHCGCCNPQYTLPPVEKVYAEDEIVAFNEFTPPSTTENVDTGGCVGLS